MRTEELRAASDRLKAINEARCGEMVRSIDGDLYICEREKAHEGKHRDTVTPHVIATWAISEANATSDERASTTSSTTPPSS